LTCETTYCKITGYTSDTQTILENFYFRIDTDINTDYTLRAPLSLLTYDCSTTSATCYLRIQESVQGNLVQFGSMFYNGFFAYFQNYYTDDNVGAYSY